MIANTGFVHIGDLIDEYIRDLEPPYKWRWLSTHEGWTLVVSVLATGQQIRCTYLISDAPDAVDAERAALRLYGLRKRENGTIGQTQRSPGGAANTPGRDMDGVSTHAP